MLGCARHIVGRSIVGRSRQVRGVWGMLGHRGFAEEAGSGDHFRLPLTRLTEDEELMKESVSRWANESLKPRVLEMDEKEQLDKDIIRQLFDQGVINGVRYVSSRLI